MGNWVNMGNNTKLLVIFSFLIIVGGLSVLWFSAFGKDNQVVLRPVESPSTVEVSPGGVASGAATLGVKGEMALVTKVVDGDTIEVLMNGQKYSVRIIGVDTPETVDPRRPVGCFGKEASNKAKEILSGKNVLLEKDVSEMDKYRRILRFVYLPLPDGTLLFFDDYMIREGYGKVLTIPPDVKYSEQFLEAQREARENKRGLWGKC